MPTESPHNDKRGPALTSENMCRDQIMTPPFNRADGWIDNAIAGSETLPDQGTLGPAALLQQLPPTITIEPFDGDPRRWDQLIGSFKALVIRSDAQRIAILRQLLARRLRASIAPSFYGPNLYSQALADLRRLFGNLNLIIDAYVKNLLDIPPMKSNEGSDVDKFFYEIHGAVNTLRVYGADADLSSRTTLQAVVSKMNRRMQFMWARRLIRPRPANLRDLDEWLEEIVTIQSNVQSDVRNLSERQMKKVKPRETRRILNTVIVERSPEECPLCKNNHNLDECSMFLSASAQERAETLKQHERCFACFKPNHQARICKCRNACNVDGCPLKHHPLLHGASPVFAARRRETTKRTVNVNNSSIKSSTTDVLLSVVRARLVTKDNISMEVRVLLDPGSEATLIRKDVVHTAGLNGPTQDIRMGTFRGNDPLMRCNRVNFKLKSLEGKYKFEVKDALTVPTLNVAHRQINFASLKQKWPHLQEIDSRIIRSNDVAVLVGMDVVEAHEQYRILKPPKGITAPRAVLTPFGWAVIGRLPANDHLSDQLPRSTQVFSVTRNSQDDDLITLVKNQWSVESLGIRNIDRARLSPEHERALSILSSSTRKTNGHYECGMLWKDAKPLVQDSLRTAQAQFAGLERRFHRDLEFS
ncbi:hypothetical protein M513_10603 [Trichuris suis]|uniref:Peptidase A2 domain-containing protein n=1 Tax=Trichuris suis TaxID=68888 RepID=A0A085LU80_9BILA|nr:hypothetical protein M513_10603 [Trichuris suis]